MKKFFSLVLALVMVMGLTTAAWGVSETTVTTAAELKDAVKSTSTYDVVKLGADITLSEILVVEKAVVIDGTKDASSNWTLTYTGTGANARAINVKTEGKVAIQNLTISAANAQRAINVITYPAELTIDNVTATASNYTLNVAASAGAAKVTVNESNLTGLCTVNVAGAGAKVTITDSTITCDDQNTTVGESYAALCLNKDATGGKITADGCTINVTTGSDSYKAKSSADGGVILIDGSDADVVKQIAFIVVGDYYYGFETVQDAIDYAVANGKTEVQVGKDAVNSGESFTEAPGVTVTLPAGVEKVDDGTGNMILAPAGTTAGGFGTMFYESDDAATKNWRLVSSFPGATVADFLVEADYDETIPYGNIEYYDVNGVAYVEATKATGAYKLVCGKTEVFLNLAADVDYEFEAEAFTGLTTDEDACGSVLVTKKNLSKTYYTATCEVGKVEYTFYFVADKNGGTDLLVGNKIVKADLIGDDFSGGAGNAFIAHDWVGNDVDAKTKAYTTLKCENCGKVAKLYANADAAGKGAVYEQYGWITAADAGYDVVVPSIPSTDKVTSAETFDAGIAMYVGMSVMAAAGSVVVLKKRED